MNAIWTALLAVAVLWPARTLSALDGVPLSGTVEAVVVGVVLPALWWLHREFLDRRSARAIVIAVVTVRLIGYAVLPQQGLCARASAGTALTGNVSTIDIDEPEGVLRSWDMRADPRSASPRCTAIVDRAYASADEFPAWWRNVTAALQRHEPVDWRIGGFIDVSAAGDLTIETGRGMTLDGTIGSAHVSSAAGRSATATLRPGVHRVDLRAALNDSGWKFVPRWNGTDAWKTTRFTVTSPSQFDRFISPIVGMLSTALVALLCVAWLWSTGVAMRWSPATVAWTACAAAAFAAAGTAGRFDRYVAVTLLGALAIPVAAHERSTRGAFMLLGVPWLALFVGRAWPLIGRATVFSAGDDWQMYQLAAYRIVMNGFWIQGGSPTFVFQPLYRWIVGVLHLLFGDSSVGETYLDAFCLLAAAMLMVAAVRRVYGFRPGVAAGALTLATFTVSPIWYLVGRSLSEITGLGFMVAAAALLIRARRGSIAWAIAAGGCATLMFYTRLNHLLVTAFLLVWMLPLRTPMIWRELATAIARVPVAPVLAYAAVISGGLILFAARTWWYTGHFSLLYGTSFGVQQTGLQPAKVAEAVAAQLSMREPPALDPRSLLVAAGALVAVLALVQVRGASGLPASLTIMTVGTIAGSLFAHTHDYPGRMSVHVVPFAVALSACAAVRLAGFTGSPVHD